MTIMVAEKISGLLLRVRRWAADIRRDVHALYLAARDPRTPWDARAVALVIAAYALSPIDLVPDFIPIVGYLDDLIIVPLGIYLAVRLIPPELMAEDRRIAARSGSSPSSKVAAAAIVAPWVGVGGAVLWRLM